MTDKKDKEEAKEKAVEPKVENKSNKTGSKEQSEKDTTTRLSKKTEKLINEIETLSVLELADLVKALEDRFGVSAAPAIAAAAPVATAAPADQSSSGEEKATFSVILTDAGSQKIQVIKAVRAIDQNLGLKEAKDKVETTPAEILVDVKKEEAEEAKKKLEEAGAKVELK